MIKPVENPVYQAIPLSPDDLIEVTTHALVSGLELWIEGTAFNEQGAIIQFSEMHPIVNTSIPESSRFRLGYKFLLSVVGHFRDSAVPDGQVHAQISLVKSPQANVYNHRKLLAQGYISRSMSIGYGSTAFNNVNSEHLYCADTIVGDPGAGQPILFTIPALSRYHILNVRYTFTTSAAAANRFIQVGIDYGNGLQQFFNSFISIPASRIVAVQHSQFPTVVYDTTLGVLTVYMPILYLESNMTFNVTAINLQAGDAFSDITVATQRRAIP